MASVLDRIPGLGGYLASRQQGEQQLMGQLGQAQAVMGLQGALQEQAQRQQLQQALAESGGDVEKAMAAAVKAGNLGGAAKLASIVEARRKASAGQPIGSGGLLKPDGTVIPPAARPGSGPAGPELVQLQRRREEVMALPEAHPNRGRWMQEIDARISKLNRDAPGVQVNMPASSDTMMGEDGKWYKVRIGKDGKVETIPLQTAGGTPLRPPQTAAERKAEQDAKEALTDVAEIERLGGELDALVTQNQGMVKGVVGPQGVVGRATELVTGAVGGETPALDFDNKSKLFLSSVRKMVEKDANLSNQERASLLGSIGVGFWQTGPSSIRARQDVMNYVKTKRVGSLKQTQQPSQEDLEFTARKHGITVEEVKRRLGAK